MQWEIINGTLVTPEEIIKEGSLTVSQDKIIKIGKRSIHDQKGIQIDLNGLIVFPGIIDGHDHLLGTYLPRVGDRKPYLNWLMWDNDLKSSPIYAERQQVESTDLYLLGGYRHLISGVTSVQDHIPHFVREMFRKNVPIRLIDKYTMAHAVCSFALPWGEIESEHQLAKENNIPFVTHCSEGFDEETKKSVSVLEKKDALSEHTVLIHGIAFSDEDIDLLYKNKVNVVWCPVSNLYMFGTTAPIKKLLEKNVNVCLGTDSPMSGSVNIFEEIYIAKKFYFEKYGTKLTSKKIVEMLTINPSRAFFRPDIGSLKQNNKADFIVIDGDPKQPYEAFTSMQYENIMLVVIDGIPKYADENFIPLFETLDIPFQKIKVAGSKKIIEGDVLGLLNRIKNSVNFDKKFDFLPIEPC
ncbi:MAG: amidohydrolase family protein [Spirochaetia bacterium]|nr:amidohydrolase family protein [Spirochaetia bacterium]